MIYSSHKYKKDKDRNGLWGDPLPYEEKAKWLKKVYGNMFVESDYKVLPDILKEIYDKGYRELYFVAGSDRLPEYRKLVWQYNNYPTKKGTILYDFDLGDREAEGDPAKKDLWHFIPAGEERDDNASGVAAVSGTGTRKLAYDGNLEGFKQAVPFDDKDAEELYNVLRKELGAEDEVEEDLLTEDPVGTTVLKKNLYIKNKDEVEDELNRFGLDAPDPDKGLDDYRDAPTGDNGFPVGYNGLYVKQGSNPEVSFSEKDLNQIAQMDSSIPNDIVDILDNLVILDSNGRQYCIHKSGNVIGMGSGNKKGGGRVTFGSGTIVTYYQEAIISLLLLDRIPEAHSDDFEEWLKNSDPEKGTGVFNYILPWDANFKSFNEKWSSFVNDWIKAFKTVLNSRETFVNVVNEKALINKDVENAVIIHNGVRNSYSSVAKSLLSGKDVFDKSDVYYCVGNVGEITSTMEELSQSSIKDYVQYMTENTDKIIGVSIKKPSGNSIQVSWDIPAKDEDYFKGTVMWTGSDDKTQVLRFDTEDGEIQFNIRSNKNGAGGTLEWKSKGAQAQMGKAVAAFDTVLSGNEKNQEVRDSVRTPLSKSVRDFNLAAKNLMIAITGEPDPEKNVPYQLTDYGKWLVTKVFNLACGFSAYDNGEGGDGRRVTTPYIKVY